MRQAVWGALPICRTLENLHLNLHFGCSPGSIWAVLALAKALSRSPALKTLRLRSPFGHRCWLAFAEALRSNTALEVVYLRNSKGSLPLDDVLFDAFVDSL